MKKLFYLLLFITGTGFAQDTLVGGKHYDVCVPPYGFSNYAVLSTTFQGGTWSSKNSTIYDDFKVYLSYSGKHTYHYTKNNVVVDSLTVNIIERKYPNVAIDYDHCAGDSISLLPDTINVNPAWNYTWSKNNTDSVIASNKSIKILADDFANEYLIFSATDTFGCMHLDTAYYGITTKGKSTTINKCIGRDTALSINTYSYENFTWNNQLNTSVFAVTENTTNQQVVAYQQKYGGKCWIRDTFNIQPVACDSVHFITGKVFWDDNSNGILDNNEKGVPYVKVSNDNPTKTTYTDSDGNYQFAVYTTLTTSITAAASKTTHTLSTAGKLPGETHHLNFPLEGQLSHTNMSCSNYTSTLRPGFSGLGFIQLYNYGPSPANNIQIKYVADPFLQVTVPDSLQQYFTSQVGDTLFFELDQLAVGAFKKLTVVLTVPAGEEHLGKSVALYSAVTTSNTDYQLSNNTYSRNTIIRGSYDPNHKEANIGDGAMSLDTKELHYTIQFQNTGTDTAFKIVVIDTLDLNYFKLASFNMVASSHHYNLNVDSAGVATWTFNNILLVDSITNEPLSHGVINFSLELKDGIPLNQNIYNKASIYFDYNSPIVTNTAFNYYSKDLSANELESSIQELYPNPTNDLVTLTIDHYESASKVLFVRDAFGRIVLQNQVGLTGGKNFIQVNLSGLANGIYFVQLGTKGKAIKVMKN